MPQLASPDQVKALALKWIKLSSEFNSGGWSTMHERDYVRIVGSNTNWGKQKIVQISLQLSGLKLRKNPIAATKLRITALQDQLESITFKERGE